MKKLLTSVLVSLMFCMCGTALADCGDCDDSAQCKAGEGCCMEKAMAALPKMTFTAGSEKACCEASAKAMAKKNSTEIHYVVGEKEFDDKEKAMVTLADMTEEFVDSFASPHTCSVSGKTSVCGTSMACSTSAAKMAEVAKSAMQTVSMTYKVGDKSCHCPMEAAKMAKASGEPQHYVVGDKETCCSVDARIKLAHAKYRAALEALAKISAEEEATTPVSTNS